MTNCTLSPPIESSAVKDYSVMYNIGKCRYVINYCDGVKTHADGSRFYDIAIFSNKRALNARIAELKRAGYTEK